MQARLTAQGPDTYYKLFTKQLYHTQDQQTTDNSARELTLWWISRENPPVSEHQMPKPSPEALCDSL